MTAFSDKVVCSKTSSDLSRLPLCISVVVWGGSYTEFFLNFCLPSLLADGNFPAIRHRKGSVFVIHTSAADAEKIETSRVFQAILALIDVDLKIIDISAIPPHELLSRCHDDAIRTGDSFGRPIVFLAPDAVWSNNTFEAIDAAICSGKRVLFLPNVRAVKEDCLDLLRGLTREDRIDASPRALMSIAIRHLHPTTEEHMVLTGRGERLLPPALLWANARGDLLGHFFHHHPLMVFPRKKFAAFNQTIDGDFVQFACPNPNDYQIVLDSDQAACVEFSARSQFIGGITSKEDARGVMQWAEHGANPVHWGLLSYRVRLHALPISEADWNEVERQADDFISQVFRWKRWWILATVPMRLIRALKFSIVWTIAKATGIELPPTEEWHKGTLKRAANVKMLKIRYAIFG